MANNKRESERSPIELAASYGIAADADIYNEAIIKNVSEGGFAFQSKDNIQIGKEFSLEVELSDNEAFSLQVKAVWSRFNYDTDDFTIGVQIVEKSQEKLDKFNKFYSSEID